MISKNKKEYSNDLRELVIKHFLNGDSEREIAKKVLIPRDSLHCIIAKWKPTKFIGTLKGQARRRKTSTNTDRILQRKARTDRRKSVACVKVELENELKIKISESAVRRRLHDVRLYKHVARNKPYVNKANRRKTFGVCQKPSREAFRFLE